MRRARHRPPPRSYYFCSLLSRYTPTPCFFSNLSTDTMRAASCRAASEAAVVVADSLALAAAALAAAAAAAPAAVLAAARAWAVDGAAALEVRLALVEAVDLCTRCATRPTLAPAPRRLCGRCRGAGRRARRSRETDRCGRAAAAAAAAAARRRPRCTRAPQPRCQSASSPRRESRGPARPPIRERCTRLARGRSARRTSASRRPRPTCPARPPPPARTPPRRRSPPETPPATPRCTGSPRRHSRRFRKDNRRGSSTQCSFFSRSR